MAKETEVKAAEVKAAALVPASFTDMITAERPSGVDEGILGSEGIGQDDITIPRLAVAQKMSPEIDETVVAKYIKDLKFMDLFNSMTKKVYGKGPLHFVILKRLDPRWIEYFPISEGGGIKDRHVYAGDPRTEFGRDGEKPVATMFLDYMILLLNDLGADPMDNVMALSLKSSAIKAAKHLNFLVGARGKKQICKGVYEVTTGSDTDKKSGGVFAIYKFKNAGWLKEGTPLETMAVEMFDAWKDRETRIDEEGVNVPDVDDSMGANPE